MPNIADPRGVLRENLADAGCGPELIEQFMALVEQGNKDRGLALLAQHRKALLDCCHAEQRKIDCLDYLEPVPIGESTACAGLFPPCFADFS